MSASHYAGVYSNISAGTSVGTEIKVSNDKLTKVTSKSRDRQYQSIKKATLEDADLNVAKLRLVSTIPGKQVNEEVRDKAYVGFILTGVQENHNEKVEIVPLPGDSFASYFYGANPRQYAFSGILLNTDQDQWRDSFEQIYEKYLRGSSSSRDFSIVQVNYNGRVVSGWLTNLSQQLDSNNDQYATFNFAMLVSRVDMIGGTKNFSDYLVKLPEGGGDFAGANLDTDYAILDPSNYNAMIDPIRTGMVIPPKRPKKSRKRKAVSCYFPALTDDAGNPINSGNATNNSHINDATVCTVTEKIEGSQRKIKDLFDRANKLAKNANTQKELDEAKKLQRKAQRLAAGLKEARGRKDVKEQLKAEINGAIDLLVADSKQRDSKGEFTDRAKRAQALLNQEEIKVNNTTVQLGVENEGYRITDVDLDVGDREPTLYDGTKYTEDVLKGYTNSLTSSDGQSGQIDKANARLNKKRSDEKKKRKEERDKKSANKLFARIKFK